MEEIVLRHLHCFVTALLMSAASLPAAATEVRLAGAVMAYTGTCEPSAAVSVSPTDFRSPMVVASDEDNVLRIYRASAGGEPIRSVDINGFLGLDPNDDDQKADLEAATSFGGNM